MAKIINLNTHPQFQNSTHQKKDAQIFEYSAGAASICPEQIPPDDNNAENDFPSKRYSLPNFRSALRKLIEDHSDEALSIIRVRMLRIDEENTLELSKTGCFSLAFIIVEYRTIHTGVSNDLFVAPLIIEDISDIKALKKLIHDMCAVETEAT